MSNTRKTSIAIQEKLAAAAVNKYNLIEFHRESVERKKSAVAAEKGREALAKAKKNAPVSEKAVVEELYVGADIETEIVIKKRKSSEYAKNARKSLDAARANAPAAQKDTLVELVDEERPKTPLKARSGNGGSPFPRNCESSVSSSVFNAPDGQKRRKIISRRDARDEEDN